jgi:acetyltransferase-like isoleucine patch superfamily enzyme
MSGMAYLRRARRRLAARLVHAAWRWVRQAGTITADTAAGRRFAAFGHGSLIAFPTGTIFGERWIEVGDGTMLAEQVSVCAGMMPGHDLGSGSVLRIGDRCVIGRGSHIVAHHSIDIGDDVFTGPYVYITDQNHAYADPDLPIGRQWPVNAAVRIGSGTWLGTGVIILPGAVIGRNVVVAAGSVVRGEIGDRCVVAGVPARVIKNYSSQAGWTRRAADSPRADSAFREAVAGDPRLTEFVLAPVTAAGALPLPLLADGGPAEGQALADRDR